MLVGISPISGDNRGGGGHNQSIRPARAIPAALLGVAALIVPGAGGIGAAAAAPAPVLATIEASFAPDRLGVRTAVTFSFHITGGEDGVPPPLRKVLLLIPGGLSGPSLEWPTTLGCSRAQLMRRGARGCPARSQIGSGSALVAWREGSQTVTEHAKLWMFVGPTDGAYQLQILGEGTTPIRRRVVSTVSLAAISGTYSASLESVVPPIATRPRAPDASIVSFSITNGNAKQPRFSGRGLYGGMGLFVPSPCPAGGFPWQAEFSFAGSPTQLATTAIACP
jgi:hypothetical protein